MQLHIDNVAEGHLLVSALLDKREEAKACNKEPAVRNIDNLLEQFEATTHQVQLQQDEDYEVSFGYEF